MISCYDKSINSRSETGHYVLPQTNFEIPLIFPSFLSSESYQIKKFQKNLKIENRHNLVPSLHFKNKNLAIAQENWTKTFHKQHQTETDKN